MSSKTLNAKKAKTESELRNYFNLAYLAIGVLLALSLFLMPRRTIQGGPYSNACFNDSCFVLEDAITKPQLERGLSDHYSLPKNAGMFFVFNTPARRCMWMKGMRFNLDIVWLDKNYKVINTAQDLSPATYPESFCADKTKYVLEVNSGKVAKSDIRVGDYAKL